MKRAEAKALGLKFYNTGKPCKHGHLSDRYASTAICVECVKIAGVDRYKNNREAQYASWRKWYEANKETHHTRSKRWQAANPEKVKEAAKLWVAANPEKVAAKTKRYRQAHPDQTTAWAVASVARRSKRVPNWLTPDDKWMLKEAYSLAKLRTKLFGFVWEVDHVLPLRGSLVSGLHVPTNIQVIPKALNRAKRNVYHPN
jgi:hypothetical protein